MPIIVDLPQKYGLEFETQYFEDSSKIQPMEIPGCQRCIALLIFWQDFKMGTKAGAITAAHIGPCPTNQDAWQKQRWFFSELERTNKEAGGEHLTPYMISVAGGMIDTNINSRLYNRSLRYFVYPFEKKYPGIQIIGWQPTKNTGMSHLYLSEVGEIDCQEQIFIYEKAV